MGSFLKPLADDFLNRNVSDFALQPRQNIKIHEGPAFVWIVLYFLQIFQKPGKFFPYLGLA